MTEDSSPKPNDTADKRDGSSNSQDSKAGKASKKLRALAGSALFVGIVIAIISPYLNTLGSHISNLLDRPAGQPVEINLVMQRPDIGGVMAFPAPLSSSQLASLDSLNQNSLAFQRWLTSHGAAAVGAVSIELVVQGNRNNPVRIINIEPTETCRKPLTAALYYWPPAGADVVTRLALDLDHPQAPAGYYVRASDQLQPSYFSAYTVSLKRGEQFTFDIIAATAVSYCTFSLNMIVLDGTRQLTEVVRDNGRPFRVTAGLYSFRVGGFARYQNVYFYGKRVNPSTFSG